MSKLQKFLETVANLTPAKGYESANIGAGMLNNLIQTAGELLVEIELKKTGGNTRKRVIRP